MLFREAVGASALFREVVGASTLFLAWDAVWEGFFSSGVSWAGAALGRALFLVGAERCFGAEGAASLGARERFFSVSTGCALARDGLLDLSDGLFCFLFWAACGIPASSVGWT